MTKPAVQTLFAFHILKLKKVHSRWQKSNFSSQICNYTVSDHKAWPAHPDPNGLYVCFEVSIFCVYLRGASHCVFSHKPRNVVQNKSIISRKHLNLPGEKNWLQFLLFPQDLKTRDLACFVVCHCFIDLSLCLFHWINWIYIWTGTGSSCVSSCLNIHMLFKRGRLNQ